MGIHAASATPAMVKIVPVVEMLVRLRETWRETGLGRWCTGKVSTKARRTARIKSAPRREIPTVRFPTLVVACWWVVWPLLLRGRRDPILRGRNRRRWGKIAIRSGGFGRFIRLIVRIPSRFALWFFVASRRLFRSRSRWLTSGRGGVKNVCQTRVKVAVRRDRARS